MNESTAAADAVEDAVDVLVGLGLIEIEGAAEQARPRRPARAARRVTFERYAGDVRAGFLRVTGIGEVWVEFVGRGTAIVGHPEGRRWARRRERRGLSVYAGPLVAHLARA